MHFDGAPKTNGFEGRFLTHFGHGALVRSALGKYKFLVRVAGDDPKGREGMETAF